MLRRFAEIIVKWNTECYYGEVKQNSQHFVQELIHWGILKKTNKEMEAMTDQELSKPGNENIKLFKQQMNLYKSILKDLKRSDLTIGSIYGEKYKSIKTHSDLDYYFAMKIAKGDKPTDEEESLLKTADRTFWLQYYHVEDQLKVIYKEIKWVDELTSFMDEKKHYNDKDIIELCLKVNQLSDFAQDHVNQIILDDLARGYEEWDKKRDPKTQSLPSTKDPLVFKLKEILSDYKKTLTTFKVEKENLRSTKEPLTKNQLFKRFFSDCLIEKKVNELDIPKIEKLLGEFDKNQNETDFDLELKSNFTEEVYKLFKKITLSNTSKMCCHYNDPIETKSFLPQFNPK
jgi:hypothetical protein